MTDNNRIDDKRMKAWVCTEYGSPDVLRLENVEKPTVTDDELLIEIYSTTVTSGDHRVRSLDMPAGFGLISRLILGVTRPRNTILGTELAGKVVATGEEVRKFEVGDEVFGFPDDDMGCHAEFVSVSEDEAVDLKPDNLSFDEAAALSFGGTTALYFFGKADITPGDNVLVNGASGSVGSAAVQLANHYEADVTGVCSTDNLDVVRSIGANRVIDYTRMDVTGIDETYDIVVDTVGEAPVSQLVDLLNENGRLLLVAAGLPAMLKVPWVALSSSKRIIVGQASGEADQLALLADLVENGVYEPVVDRVYPFEEIPEAHRYVDTGHKTGNVVIEVR